MTVTKEILMQQDFITNLSDELCNMLENIIDAEFDKGDETDFDFIDECADAINALRSGNNAQILPIISRRAFLKKVGLKSGHGFRVVVAACAAIAVITALAVQFEIKENVTVVQVLYGMVSELFNSEKPADVPAVPEITTTQKTSELISISIETDENFKTEYDVGEKFRADGIKVFGEYDNGERKLINDYSVTVPDDFGKKPGYEIIEISLGGFTETVRVRVIETVETKKLTSIYAVFPDETDLTKMQVYAVYSNGDERELSADEYTVTREQIDSLFRKYVTVTVEYEGCSCSFNVEKEEQ